MTTVDHETKRLLLAKKQIERAFKTAFIDGVETASLYKVQDKFNETAQKALGKNLFLTIRDEQNLIQDFKRFWVQDNMFHIPMEYRLYEEREVNLGACLALMFGTKETIRVLLKSSSVKMHGLDLEISIPGQGSVYQAVSSFKYELSHFFEGLQKLRDDYLAITQLLVDINKPAMNQNK